jgi:hypothetical protein
MSPRESAALKHDPDPAEAEETRIGTPVPREAALRALASLRDGDAEEQEQTFEFLREALDADRPSRRHLF